MYKTVVLLALAVVLLLGSGCGRESQGAAAAKAHISLTAIPFPAAVGDSRLVIQVTDLAGKPVSDARLSVKGDMTHAGMVPVLAESQAGDKEGYYNVPFEWTMAGDWVVTVEVTLNDGRRAVERFDLTVLTEDEAVCTDDNPQGKPLPAGSQE
jgi:hypothetical protein